MDYIKQLNAFYYRMEYWEPLSANAIALWNALMHIANKNGWQEYFTATNRMLELASGLEGMSLHRAKNELVQRGLLIYLKGKGKYALSKYSLPYLYDTVSGKVNPIPYHNDTVPDTVNPVPYRNDTVPDTVPDMVPDMVPGIINNKHKQDVNKNTDQTHTYPSAMGECAKNDLPNETDNAKKPNRKERKPKNKGSDDMSEPMRQSFETFWESYPRKISKGTARKAWLNLNPSSELLTKMLSSIRRAKTCDNWIREGGRYIPYPASWLNAEGWEDEIPSQTQGNSPPANQKKNRFVNFNQRDIDFAELERLELEQLKASTGDDQGQGG